MANSDENSSDRIVADEDSSIDTPERRNSRSQPIVIISRGLNSNSDETRSEDDDNIDDDDDNIEDDENDRNNVSNDIDHGQNIAQQSPRQRVISVEPNRHKHDRDHHNHHHHHRHHDHQQTAHSDENLHQYCRHQEAAKHHHHHHHHHRHNDKAGHVKELIKPDPTVRAQKARSTVLKGSKSPRAAAESESRLRIATVVDEELLHKRFVESKSEKHTNSYQKSTCKSSLGQTKRSNSPRLSKSTSNLTDPSGSTTFVSSSDNSGINPKESSSSSSAEKSHSSSEKRSPPPNAIVIPPSVTKSLSSRAFSDSSNKPDSSSSSKGSTSSLTLKQNAVRINSEQLEYGSLLKQGEVQMLYRSPESESLGVFQVSLVSLYPLLIFSFLNTLNSNS